MIPPTSIFLVTERFQYPQLKVPKAKQERIHGFITRYSHLNLNTASNIHHQYQYTDRGLFRQQTDFIDIKHCQTKCISIDFDWHVFSEIDSGYYMRRRIRRASNDIILH